MTFGPPWLRGDCGARRRDAPLERALPIAFGRVAAKPVASPCELPRRFEVPRVGPKPVGPNVCRLPRACEIFTLRVPGIRVPRLRGGLCVGGARGRGGTEDRKVECEDAGHHPSAARVARRGSVARGA